MNLIFFLLMGLHVVRYTGDNPVAYPVPAIEYRIGREPYVRFEDWTNEQWNQGVRQKIIIYNGREWGATGFYPWELHAEYTIWREVVGDETYICFEHTPLKDP